MFNFANKRNSIILLHIVNLIIQYILLSDSIVFPVFKNNLSLYLDPWMGFLIASVFPYYIICQFIRWRITMKRIDLIVLLIPFCLPILLALTISNLGRISFLNDIKIGNYVTNDYNFSRLGDVVSLLSLAVYYCLFFVYSIYNFYKYLRSIRAKALPPVSGNTK